MIAWHWTWCTFQNEVHLKKKHTTVCEWWWWAGRGSVGILTASFGALFPESDPALGGIEHMLMIHCFPCFLFSVMAERTQSEFVSSLSSLPLNTVVIAVVIRNYTRKLVSWDVLFVSLEYRGFMYLFIYGLPTSLKHYFWGLNLNGNIVALEYICSATFG